MAVPKDSLKLHRRPSVVWIEGDQDLVRFKPGTLGLFDVEAGLDGDNSVSQQAINEQVKRNLLQVSNSLDDLQTDDSSAASRYLFGSFYQNWKHSGRSLKKLYINRIIRQYCFRFKTAIVKNSFPGQAMYLFETTLKMDNLIDLFAEEASEDLIEFNVKEMAWLYFYGISGVKLLVKALDITYNMITKLGTASHFLVELLEKEGFVSKESKEHKMCIETYWELLNLIQRMELLSNLWKRKLIHSFVGNQLILSAFSVPLASIEALRLGFTENLYASSVTEVKLFLLVFCETLHKVAASLCFVLSQCFRFEEIDLKIILKDYISVMKHSDDKIQSYIQDFDMKNSLERNQDDALVELSKQTYFSREHKLMRQYYWMGNLCYRFQSHTSSLASMVQTYNQEKEKDPEVARSLARKIHEQHDHAVGLLHQITLFMKAQGKFIRMLETDPPEVEDVNADSFETAGESNHQNQVTVNENLDVTQPIEYNCDSDDMPDEEVEPCGKDELFVRFPELERKCEIVSSREEHEEENIATSLYSGVLTQLNETLASIKAKKEKNEDDLLKQYILNSGFEDVGLESEASGISVDLDLQQEDLPILSDQYVLVDKVTRNKKSTKRYVKEIGSEDESYGGAADPIKPGFFAVRTCGADFSSSFMSELQSKLDPRMMAKITELTSDGDASSSSGDEENLITSDEHHFD